VFDLDKVGRIAIRRKRSFPKRFSRRCVSFTISPISPYDSHAASVCRRRRSYSDSLLPAANPGVIVEPRSTPRRRRHGVSSIALYVNWEIFSDFLTAGFIQYLTAISLSSNCRMSWGLGVAPRTGVFCYVIGPESRLGSIISSASNQWISSP
jgi:hypothetical protein